MAPNTVAVDLPAEIFDVQVNVPLIHQVVVAQQAAARQGTHATKTRGEVRGGGRKPYKQKGTGRARQGSTRAPQFAGGGTVHGPQPRSYDQRTPKKMKAAALRGALSDRARAGLVHVVESFVSGDKPSTKGALATLAALAGDQARPRRSLVVLERGDDLTWLSLRNVDTVHIIAVDQLNTYDVLLCDDVVFTKGAYDAFVAGPSTGKSVKAVATSSEAAPVKAAAAEQADDDKVGVVAPDEYPNSAAPLDNGDAPAGYEIKGKKDSMKYHAPGGRWYDNTVAEVWFKTAADAEAAGFVEAGTKAAPATEEGDK
ncbi:MAG: 50S ribosomal protein L4, sunset domain variant [Nocardioides sp.]